MRLEKKILPSRCAKQSTSSKNNALRVTKVECESPDQFAIHVKVHNRSTTVIRCTPELFLETLRSLAEPNPQQQV